MAFPRPCRRVVLLVTTLWFATGLCATQGLAQSVERNLPAQSPPPEVPIVVPAPESRDDPTPIGPNLSSLVIVGGLDAVDLTIKAPPGVALQGDTRLEGDEQDFARFLGQPLSRKLISDIQARILAVYRARGHPLVSISTPPQDITDGVLRIRVVEYTLGVQKVTGADRDEAEYIAGRVRLVAGETINTNRLTQDLEWLNRYPFRRVTVAFAPSERTGGTDVTLQAASARPWQVSAGYSNSGSPDTGIDRYFVSGQASLPGLRDVVVSYQGTVSGDALSGNSLGEARYRSNAVLVSGPTFPRQSVDLTVNAIETRQPFEVFVAETWILETTAVWRSAASNVWPSAPGEFSLGVAAKQSESTITFDGIPINEARFEVYQLVAGYVWRGPGRFGVSQFGVNLFASPGDINAYNTDAAFSAYSAGRFESARYAYASAELSNLSPPFQLFGVDELQLFNSLTIQLSGKALPSTEQAGLGGASAVRGYTLDDGAFDTVAVLRNELRFGASSPLGRDDTLAPYLFADLGYGESRYYGEGQSAASFGAGLGYYLGQGVSLSVDAVAPLQDMGKSRAGRGRLEARLVLAF